MDTIKDKVSVVIPAYNEGHHIVGNLAEIDRTFKAFGCRYELIVVDDGSKDGTYEELAKAAKGHAHIIVKRNRRNYGKGRAIKRGVRFAAGEYTVLLDADMDLHPGQIQAFFDIMRLDDADAVIGSKMHPNSRVTYPWHRRIVSGVYFALVRFLFDLPIRDTQTGLKLFKTKVIKKAFNRILVKKFAYDLELLISIHRKGCRIAEAPVVMEKQQTWPRVRWRDIYNTWWDTMAIWYRTYILHWYSRK